MNGQGYNFPAFDISFIVPCHNEAGNVGLLAQRIAQVFGEAGITTEIVFVDDGSTDSTWNELRALAQTGVDVPSANVLPAIQAIRFSRNFGKESALYAGMETSHGNTVCFIDADLQQNPAVALDMYEYLVSHSECDVVAAYQEQRSEGKGQSWLKKRFYQLFNATSDEIELPPDMSDFRVFTRQVAEALLSMPEYHRFTKGLFAWVGFNTHAIPYTAEERAHGESTWSTRSLFKYALSGIASFSTWPLKVLKGAGGLVALLSVLYLLYVVIVDYFILGIDIPGYPTLVCLILLFGGLQLSAIGIVGDYLARSYIEGKRRPLYIVKETIGSEP